MTNETIVTLPKDVANAIEKLRDSGWSEANLLHAGEFVNVTNYTPEVDGEHSGYAISEFLCADFTANLPKYVSALVTGFQVEMTPEEKVAEYYESLFDANQFDKKEYVLVKTLNLLGVNIPGVNVR